MEDALNGFVALEGRGALAIWCDVASSDIDRVDAWYTYEHVPERVGIPGFLRGRRYKSMTPLEDDVRYFTLYETEALSVLSSEDYVERLDNPTPLTRETVPFLKNLDRAACKITHSRGNAIGGALFIAAFEPSRGSEQALRKRLLSEFFPTVTGHTDVLGVHLCETDPATTKAKDQTAEGKATAPSSQSARWLLLIESQSDDPFDAIEERSREVVASSSGLSVERLQLMMCLSK